MKSQLFANAKDIDSWANRRDAQSNLPRLIRKLAWFTSKRIDFIQFRSDEGIALGGWDGIIQVPEGNAYVPEGTSGWELTTEKNTKSKADDDYDKRSQDPKELDKENRSFVFVTARNWPNKNVWAKEKQDEKIWKNVRAYDASDLELWLEHAPPVHYWFSIQLGTHPIGAIDLDSFWDAWSHSTSPPINPDLVIAGREDNISKILQWLQSGPSILGLQAESQHEAIAYFISSLSRLKIEERDKILAQAIIVEDTATWRQLALWESPLILIPTFPDLKMINVAVENGHHILVPLDKTEPPIGNTLSILRLHRMEAEKALLAMGLPDKRAKDLAALARRSFEAMRRELAENAISLTPEWSKQPEIARSLLPALLAGQWDDKKTADQEVISSLARREYPEFREILISWSRKPDPPVRLVEHTWMVSAREDAWMLLARHLTDEVAERFASTAINVLKDMDPKFELPVDERWLANIHGKVPKNSFYLMGGIAETLALMATLSDQRELTTRSGQDWSNYIVGAILDGVTDWKLWASLSPVLQLLAEASPEIFLGALERNLATPSPSLGINAK